jgi:hypothetical protein
MKRLAIVSFALFGISISLGAALRHSDERPEVSPQKLVSALRTVTTAEHSYRQANGKFSDLQSLLAFSKKEEQQGRLTQPPVDLESLSPYVIEITTSSDGMHYQIILKRPAETNDKTTWCKPAAFSDDKGIIFLGQAIGCDGASK